MRFEHISAYVLAYNEAPNLARCLDALAWVPRVVVVDSQSTDGTQTLAAAYPNVEVVERAFDNLRDQHCFALSLVADSPWVLRLDSDWIVSAELVQEITRLTLEANVAAVCVPFKLAVHGQLVPIALYPPVACLFRPAEVEYVQDGHTERLVPRGKVVNAKATILHDDRKPIERFLLSQIRYSRDELGKIEGYGAPGHPPQSRSVRQVAKIFLQGRPGLAALAVAVYLGVIRLGFFRGAAARHYIIQRTLTELMVALRVVDTRLRSEP